MIIKAFRFFVIVGAFLGIGLGSAQGQSPAKMIQEARSHIELTQYADALTLLKKVEKKDKGIAEVFYLKALCYSQMSEKDKALEAIYQAVLLNPHDAVYHALKGKLWFAKGEIENGMNAINKSLSIDSLNPEALLFRADWRLDNGQFADALHDLKLLQRVIKNDDGLWYRLGYAYQGLQQYQKAVFYLKKVVTVNIIDEMAYWNLGLSYEALHKYDSSLIYLHKLVAQVSTNWEYHFEIGICYEKKYRYSDAEKAFARAYELNKKTIEAGLALARIYAKTDRFNNALITYNELLVRHASNPLVYFEKAKTTALYGTRDQALKDFYSGYLVSNPSNDLLNSSFFACRAWINYMKEDTKEALSDLRFSIKEQKTEINGALSYLLNDDKNAKPFLDMKLKLSSPPESYDDAETKSFAYFIKACEQLKNKEIDQATLSFGEVLKTEQEHLLVYFIASLYAK